MIQLVQPVIDFLNAQGFVIVSTVDKDGSVHTSCKGIIRIEKEGRLFLLDVYRGRTLANLELNPNITLTCVDEHKFAGFALKGKVKIIKGSQLSPELLKAWEQRLTSRLTQRLVKNIRGEKGHARHPEALLPGPQYVIEMEVGEIVDLTPKHLK